jgi:hypothetical protein
MARCVLLDYDAGNVRSAKRGFDAAGGERRSVTRDPDKAAAADVARRPRASATSRRVLAALRALRADRTARTPLHRRAATGVRHLRRHAAAVRALGGGGRAGPRSAPGVHVERFPDWARRASHRLGRRSTPTDGCRGRPAARPTWRGSGCYYVHGVLRRARPTARTSIGPDRVRRRRLPVRSCARAASSGRSSTRRRAVEVGTAPARATGSRPCPVRRASDAGGRRPPGRASAGSGRPPARGSRPARP